VSCQCFPSSCSAAAALGRALGRNAESARRRPYLVVLGLTLSFAVFTLFGSLILASLHLPDDAIRWLGLALLVLVGLGLLVPPLGHLIRAAVLPLPSGAPLGTGRNGFLLGIALGAVFVPWRRDRFLAAITVAGATGHIGPPQRPASPWASPSAPRSRCSPSRWRAAA